jgi:hypothetical protein
MAKTLELVMKYKIKRIEARRQKHEGRIRRNDVPELLTWSAE